MMFGRGAIVGKLGVANFNPILFAMIRECVAGPLLLMIAFYREGFAPIARRDVGWFILSGMCLFCNQLGFIVGEKLSSAVIGSAWQPTQPIFSCVIAIMLGWERPTLYKLAGITICFLGAAFMVTTSATEFGVINVSTGDSAFAGMVGGWWRGSVAGSGWHTPTTQLDPPHPTPPRLAQPSTTPPPLHLISTPPHVGNVLFFFNCLGTSMYVIVSRRLLKTYRPMTVTGWSYITASVQMCVVGLLINTSPGGVEFVCPSEDDEDDGPSCSAWDVPVSAVLPLAYWVAFNSIGAYLLMTWANCYADPSNVLGYTGPFGPFSKEPLGSGSVATTITKLV